MLFWVVTLLPGNLLLIVSMGGLGVPWTSIVGMSLILAWGTAEFIIWHRGPRNLQEDEIVVVEMPTRGFRFTVSERALLWNCARNRAPKLESVVERLLGDGQITSIEATSLRDMVADELRSSGTGSAAQATDSRVKELESLMNRIVQLIAHLDTQDGRDSTV